MSEELFELGEGTTAGNPRRRLAGRGEDEDEADGLGRSRSYSVHGEDDDVDAERRGFSEFPRLRQSGGATRGGSLVRSNREENRG